MKSVYTEDTPVRDICVGDEVWGQREWCAVVQVSIEVDETYVIHLEGCEHLSLQEDDTLGVRYWVD